jgi:hypothetical protein
VRSLPPPAHDPGPPPDLSEGFDPIAREAIEIGEQALTDLRENTVARWISAGGAWKILQLAAQNRSGSNVPSGQRYNRVYAVLVHAWPQLAKVDKATRAHAVWLYENSDAVLRWLATLSQKERDKWVYPGTIRRHYEKRHPYDMAPNEPPPRRKGRDRHQREWNRKPLGGRSYEDLMTMIGELGQQVADRDREILELHVVVEEKDREIGRLRNDLAWERMANRQLEDSQIPPGATVLRPDGEAAEIVHAITRASHEIVPPESHGYPDYSAWAKLVIARTGELSAIELRWLLIDNSAHLDAYEEAYPGAGVGLEDRINARIAELESAEISA